MDTPVTLPPGRERLATSPTATGSLPTVNTIGIDAVAAFAARAAGVLEGVEDNVNLPPNKVSREAGNRSYGRPPSGSRSSRFDLR